MERGLRILAKRRLTWSTILATRTVGNGNWGRNGRAPGPLTPKTSTPRLTIYGHSVLNETASAGGTGKRTLPSVQLIPAMRSSLFEMLDKRQASTADECGGIRRDRLGKNIQLNFHTIRLSPSLPPTPSAGRRGVISALSKPPSFKGKRMPWMEYLVGTMTHQPPESQYPRPIGRIDQRRTRALPIPRLKRSPSAFLGGHQITGRVPGDVEHCVARLHGPVAQ